MSLIQLVPPAARLTINRLRYLVGRGQSDEATILSGLVAATGISGDFVEFGFHPAQFNCIDLRGEGLLIDGDAEAVAHARKILPSRIDARRQFLTIDTLDAPRRFLRDHPNAVLSIDVDGNDYWFLAELIEERPAIISVEYNASFGRRPLTVAYDPEFRRHDYHASGWFHGASLTALSGLCAADYDLVAVSSNGVNAFFVRRDINSRPAHEPVLAYRESRPRNRWSRTTADQQWATLFKDGMVAKMVNVRHEVTASVTKAALTPMYFQ